MIFTISATPKIQIKKNPVKFIFKSHSIDLKTDKKIPIAKKILNPKNPIIVRSL